MKKSLLKLTLLLTVISSSVFAGELKLARGLYQASQTTAKRIQCPSGVQQLLNTPWQQYNNNSLNKAAKNFKLEDAGFIFAALVERFFDKKNTESFSEHVDLFNYANTKVFSNRISHVGTFVAKLNSIKKSKDAKLIAKTIDEEMDKLSISLMQSPKQQEKRIAEKINRDIRALLDQKGRIACGNIIIDRARSN